MDAGIKEAFETDAISGINAAALAKSPPRFAWRIKPSDIGHECAAYNFWQWRWAKMPEYDGRMARLFNRGNKEEADLTSLLRASGWEIRDYSKRLLYHDVSDSYFLNEWENENYVEQDITDVSENESHIQRAKAQGIPLKQYRIKDFGGHMSGYLDGQGRHERLTWGQWVLQEYKTFNDNRYKQWIKEGVKISDPKYYGQLQIALRYRTDLPAAFMWGINKNTDDMKLEIIEPDYGFADDLIRKAADTISRTIRPARLSENSTHYKCRICDYRLPCHGIEPVAVNCRSCVNCVAIDGGKFHCNLHNMLLDETRIYAGCERHQPVT